MLQDGCGSRLRDVTEWLFLGHGEKSTLEKEDIISPNDIKYVIKYPREFNGKRVNWEDINEVIAAEIAKLLQLNTIDAEIAWRKGKRGCLMLHFIDQYGADYGETGASLLSAELGNKYDLLKDCDLKSMELITKSFSLMEDFSYFEEIKFDFIAMNIFDILIGNQDRHPFNWQILYKNGGRFFGPLYDNGASLGWQLPDEELKKMLINKERMNRFFNKMKVKAGIFENKTPPLKVMEILKYFKMNYSKELKKIVKLIKQFNMEDYFSFIDRFPLISSIRKEFLKQLIDFRKEKILMIIT